MLNSLSQTTSKVLWVRGDDLRRRTKAIWQGSLSKCKYPDCFFFPALQTSSIISQIYFLSVYNIINYLLIQIAQAVLGNIQALSHFYRDLHSLLHCTVCSILLSFRIGVKLVLMSFHVFQKNSGKSPFCFLVWLGGQESLHRCLIDSPKRKQTKCSPNDQTPYWQALSRIWVKTEDRKYY